jgi:hypothetical protein
MPYVALAKKGWWLNKSTSVFNMQNPCTTHTFFGRYHIRRDFITVALRISKSVSSFIMREETSPLSRFSLGESLGMVAFQINKSLSILNGTSRRHPAKLSQGSDYFARIRDPISLGSPAKGRLAWPERSAGNPTLMRVAGFNGFS